MSTATNNMKLTHDDYTVAWICPLEVEQIAAMIMLDSEHERLPQPPNDHNVYTLGSINGHNVVIAGLHSPGNNPAAVVVTQMRNTFQQLRFGILVGIGGGVPTKTERGNIHLGHVVVSKPVGEHSGVVQYDHGKAEVGQFRHTGYLAPPPTVLLNAAREMDVRRAMMLEDPLLNHIARIDTVRQGLRRYKYPGAVNDHLYRAEYVHPNHSVSCRKCGCDLTQVVDRRAEDSDDDDDDDDVCDEGPQLVVHRGTIAAGELVIKHGMLRDELAKQYGILCFEMEAAGALADFPCLVIRGISDYSDSHKNDRWQGYAAAAAAAYGRELFFHMPVDDVKQCKIAEHDVKQMITQVDSLTQVNRYHQIFNWLKPSDPSTNLNEAQERRQEGTGLWFLQSEPFKEWKSGTRRYLWLHGIPGCGKTVLSSTIIEHLNQQLDSSHVVLNFFFDFTDTNKQSLDKLLRSLVAQLYSRCENSRKALDKLFSSCEDGNRQPTYESLFATFLQMVNYVEKIQIIIDALDECKTRRDLLSWMKNLTSSGHAGLHLLVTSRKEEDIESELKRWLRLKDIVSIQQDSVNHDIRAYVHERLRNDCHFKRWRSKPSVQDEIETELMKKADGMFRWAACQLDILQKCLDLRMLRESLRSIPKTLQETYARILASIDENYRQYAIRILQFLTYSERPLNIQEAVDIIAVNLSEDPPFDSKQRMPEPREIMNICSSLVSLVTREVSGETFMELQLAHFSVQQYLKSEEIETTFPEEMIKVGVIFQKGINEISARGCITRICLAYLSCLDDQSSIEELKKRFPLAQYSADYWMDHARPAETKEDVQKSILNFFLQQKQGYAVWRKYFDPDNSFEREPRNWTKMATPLYYASLAGLQHTVELLLLEKGADVNVQGGRFCNALQAAAMKDNKKVVRLLLEKGADINAQDDNDGRYSNALHAASALGHKEMVRLLLEAGANVNAKIMLFNRTIHKIFIRDYREKAKLDELHSNSLQAASFSKRGYEKVVRQLVLAEPDMSVKSNWYGNALQAASMMGHKEVMQLLLEAGAKFNRQDEWYGFSLQTASFRGRKEVVQLLLEKGSDVNVKSKLYSNALQAASMMGHKEVVQLLLEARAKFNLQDEWYGFSLQTAFFRGHKEVVQLLLEAEADVNAYSEQLSSFVSRYHTEMIQLLQDKEAH